MSTEKKSYKDLQAELDTIIDRFESSAHADVDEMLRDYETADKLIAQLEERLESAQMTLNKMREN